jgi:hypothetical protein
MSRGWICWILVGAATSFGCSSGPKNVEYDQGTFYFDGPLAGEHHEDTRNALNDQFSEDTQQLARFAHHPDVLEALRRASQANKSLTPADIVRIDSAWRVASPGDAAIVSRIDAHCSRMLEEFQTRNPSFAEVMITDRRGFNVCQSNKTTDYYQGDERWWIDTFGSTKPSHGKLERDASAEAIGVSIYLPVSEPGTGNPLGVAKGLIWRDMPES